MKAGGRTLGQQPGREQSPVVPTTRASDAQIQANEVFTEARLGARHVHNHFNLERPLKSHIGDSSGSAGSDAAAAGDAASSAAMRIAAFIPKYGLRANGAIDHDTLVGGFVHAIGIAIVGFLVTAAAPLQDAAFDPATGYRIASYRGVVPTAPPGVARVDARAVARLIDRHDAVLIDVVPAEGGVRDPAIARWFSDGVAQLHKRHPRRAIIVFCLADCWMSWNAAWRLSRAGYPRVLWFAEGADGWRDIGQPLTPVTPYSPLSKAFS